MKNSVSNEINFNEVLAKITKEISDTHPKGIYVTDIANSNMNLADVLEELFPSITTTPASVEPKMFTVQKCRVTKIKRDLSELDYKWGRIQCRVERTQNEAAEAKKMSSVAKCLATKARNAYTKAEDEDKNNLYFKMVERNRHAKIMIGKRTKRHEELNNALRTEAEYIDHYLAEEDRLNKLLEKASKDLNVAKLARRHQYVQEALNDAFSQRYERAEWIPEKENAIRYKAYSVPVKCLFEDEISILDDLAILAEEKPAGWIQQGKALYQQFATIVRESDGPFVVDAKNCVVNNVAASQMSDIVGIEYGMKTPAKEMMLVNYDITGTFKIYWKFMANTYEDAQKYLHNLRVFILERLVKYGIEFHNENEVLLYDILASNNSQQKKGQAYMGEHETMIRTEKLREFGWTMNDALIYRPDNSAEWLKRSATMTTPSKVIKLQDGRNVDVKRILMCKDVDIERLFDNVTTIDGKKMTLPQRKALGLTMFDGQAIWLIDGAPTTQGRGAGLKFMAIAKPDYELPEYATDIMGNRVRVADYDILMTKSCWKCAKMGMNWYEFRDKVSELAKECPGYDLLRSVRYSDREIGDEENPRNLARQATQQIVKLLDGEADGLTRKTRQWLKKHKKFWSILSELGELDKEEEDRSPLARLFNKYPQLIVHPYVQQWLKTSWENKKNRACSGRLRTKGMYPYICQDPIAQIQICLEGRDPDSKDLGIVPEGMVNLPKVSEGKSVYCIRYPANYIVGMIVKQKNCPEFAGLGNVAVLSYYGDTITRADGDFDGDEMLFIEDKLMINMMERIIEQFKPSLIDFPHGKVKCDKPFGSEEAFVRQIAEALVRAQEYNLVGTYSNLAVICLQQASLAKDGKTCGKWLNAAKVAHVGAIVCLDLVKGADVPKELTDMLEDLNEKTRKAHKMPWNQIFSHPELTEEDVETRSDSTQDCIAGTIADDVGEFFVDFDGEEPIVWNNNILFNFIAPNVDTTPVREFTLDPEDVARIRGCRFADEPDNRTWKKIENNERIGFKDWLMLGWHNSCSLLWKMSGLDMAEKRNELYRYIRRVIMKHAVEDEWVSENPNSPTYGRKWTIVEKYVSIVRTVVGNAFAVSFKDNQVFVAGNNIDENRRGSFAMFCLHVFAEDILALCENKEITEELVRKTYLTAKQEDDVAYLDSIVPDDYVDYGVWGDEEDCFDEYC